MRVPWTEAEPPQQQPPEEPAHRDAHVVVVGAGESYGHESIQHGAPACRLILGTVRRYIEGCSAVSSLATTIRVRAAGSLEG
ncbi:hypothetical protein SAVCW2_52580 [Streptomyces avermitilis]|nr:hypothetical protein SAVCW2_52580 [Streptomyces avermitilis]